MADQPTQDGCSLALCLSPARPGPASLTLTGLPTYLPWAPASDCSYQRGGEGRALLLVSLVINEPI